MTALLLGLLAGLAALGVLLAVLGALPAPPPRVRVDETRRRPSPVDRLLGRHLPPRQRRRRRLLLGGGVAVGVVVWLVTGFVLAVVLAPLAIFGLPTLLSAPRSAVDVNRLNALEQWTRSLSGVLVVGAGIESALIASAASAPAAIRDDVNLLAARINARWPTDRAVRQFADDFDDATADLVAATLVLGAQRRGDGLAAVLDDLAASVAEEVRIRRAIEADRAKPRTTARIVTAVSLTGVAIGFVSGYFGPFMAGIGQLILVVLLGLFVGCLVWMRAVTAGTPTPRFLTATGPTAPERLPVGPGGPRTAAAERAWSPQWADGRAPVPSARGAVTGAGGGPSGLGRGV
ncbi:type II secretion system F family protein [Aquipuribacter sp. SD81]|uniref:type II secretion system F family protein n=1 Tax=Aquipuribacter sp. SD81 TaxID=3127703 RepID=UPI0030162103